MPVDETNPYTDVAHESTKPAINFKEITVQEPRLRNRHTLMLSWAVNKAAELKGAEPDVESQEAYEDMLKLALEALYVVNSIKRAQGRKKRNKSGRTCLVYTSMQYLRDQAVWAKIGPPIPATFLAFGTESDGDGTNTSAIVEFADGSVEVYNPKLIVFKD